MEFFGKRFPYLEVIFCHVFKPYRTDNSKTRENAVVRDHGLALFLDVFSNIVVNQFEVILVIYHDIDVLIEITCGVPKTTARREDLRNVLLAILDISVCIKSSLDKVNEDMSKHEHNLLYMPIIDINKPKGQALFAEYQERGVVPMAYEVCWQYPGQRLTSVSPQSARTVESFG